MPLEPSFACGNSAKSWAKLWLLDVFWKRFDCTWAYWSKKKDFEEFCLYSGYNGANFLLNTPLHTQTNAGPFTLIEIDSHGKSEAKQLGEKKSSICSEIKTEN